MKLGEIGERQLIKLTISTFPEFKAKKNDVHYIKLGDRLLALSIDGYCESTWRLPFNTWYDIGWKACAAATIDLLVKFVKPVVLMVSLNFMRDFELVSYLQVVEGIVDFCNYLGVEIGKFDTNEGQEMSITVAVIGQAEREVYQQGEIGNFVYTVSDFGYTGIVYKLFYEGKLDLHSQERVIRRGIEILKRTTIDYYLKLLEHKSELLEHVVATIDTSDGLGAALWQLAEESNCTIVIDSVPVPEEVVEFCRQHGIDILEVVFNGAEEYLPVIVTRSELPRHVQEELNLVRIGMLREGPPQVIFEGRVLPYRGWEYFKC